MYTSNPVLRRSSLLYRHMTGTECSTHLAVQIPTMLSSRMFSTKPGAPRKNNSNSHRNGKFKGKTAKLDSKESRLLGLLNSCTFAVPSLHGGDISMKANCNTRILQELLVTEDANVAYSRMFDGAMKDLRQLADKAKDMEYVTLDGLETPVYEYSSSGKVGITSFFSADNAGVSVGLKVAQDVVKGIPFSFQGFNTNKAVRQYLQAVVYPVLRIVEAVRAPLAADLYTNITFPLVERMNMSLFYTQVLQTLAAAPHVVPAEAIGCVLGYMHKDKVLVNDTVANAMLMAFSNSTDIGLLLNYLEVGFEMTNSKGYSVLTELCHQQNVESAEVKLIFGCDGSDMANILSKFNYAQHTHIVPMQYQYQSSSGYGIDSKIIGATAVSLIVSNNITHIPALLKHSLAQNRDSAKLGELQVGLLVKALVDNLDRNVKHIQSNVPEPLSQAFLTSTEASTRKFDVDTARVFPTCTIDTHVTDMSKPVYNTSAEQVHTYIVYCRVIQAILNYMRTSHLTMSNIVCKRLIDLMVRLGLHTEAIALFKKSVQYSFAGDMKDGSMDDSEFTLMNVLFDEFDSSTRHYFHPTFPNRKTARNMYIGNDIGPVPQNLSNALKSALLSISNMSGIDEREKMYAQILFLHGFQPLSLYPTFKRKVCEDLHKYNVASTQIEHGNVTLHHSRSLMRSLINYAPEALKAEMRVDVQDKTEWFGQLSSKIKTPEDAVSMLPQIPSRDMGLFNYEGIVMQTPDEGVVEMIMTISRNGCLHESLALFEMVLHFTRVKSMLGSEEVTITDPVLLKKIIDYSNMYNIHLPGLKDDGSEYKMLSSARMTEQCTSFQFHVDYLSALASMVSQCTSYTDAQFLYRTIGKALGLTRTEVPVYNKENKNIDHIAQLSLLIMSQGSDMYPSFTNSHKYRMITAHKLRQKYKTLKQDIPYPSVEDSVLTSTLCNQNGEVDLQYTEDSMQMFSFLSQSNVCHLTSHHFQDKAFLSDLVTNQDLGLDAVLQESLIKDFTQNQVTDNIVQTSIDLQNQGILKHFTATPYDKLLPLAALAQNTTLRSLKMFLKSYMMDQSLLVVKELVNISMLHNEQFAQRNITSVGRCIMSEVPIYTGHHSPYKVLDALPSADKLLETYNSVYPNVAQSFPLVTYINQCLHFDGTALDMLDRSKMGKRDDQTPASLSRLLTASKVDYNTVPVRPVKQDIDDIDKLSVVEAYGMLTSVANSSSQKNLPPAFVAKVLAKYPQLEHVKVGEDNAGNRGILGELRRTAMLRLQQNLSVMYSENVFTLTKLHLASTLFPIIEEGVGLRGIITHVVRLIHGGLPETAYQVLKRTICNAEGKLINSNDLDLIHSVIYTYEQNNRGDYVLRLFKEIVYPGVQLDLTSRFEGVMPVRVNVVKEIVSLYRSVLFSDTPLHDVLLVMHYIASIQGNITSFSLAQAIQALARIGYQKEAIDLFMMACHPEYMSNILLESYEKTIKAIIKMNVDPHVQLMGRVAKFKPLHAAMRTAFKPQRVDEFVQSERVVNQGMSATKNRVAERVGMKHARVNDAIPAYTMQSMCASLAIPKSEPANGSMSQPVYVSENIPYAYRQGMLSGVDTRSIDTFSEKQEEFGPSPFLLGFMHVFRPCSSASVRTGTKIAAVNEEVLLAALRACGDGESAYTELAYQIFLAFNHQAAPSITIPKMGDVQPGKQTAEYANLFHMLNIRGGFNMDEASVAKVHAKVSVERKLQAEAEKKEFGGACVVNGHSVMTATEAFASGRHLYQNCVLPKGVILDCRYGDTAVLSKDRTFWIPNTDATFVRGYDKYLYNAWVHHFSNSVAEFQCIGGNQVNQLLHNMIHNGPKEDSIKDKDLSDTFVDALTLYEFQYKHATQFKDVLGLPHSQTFTHAPRDLCWLDKVALLRYKNIPDMMKK